MIFKNIKTVFYLGPGASGMELFCSLLDNKKEIVILPFTLKPYQLFDKPYYKKKDINYLIKVLKNSKFKHLLWEYRNKKNYYNINNEKNSKFFDWKEFETTLKKNFKKYQLSRKNIIKLIYLSYAAGANKNLKKIKYFFIDAAYYDFTDKIIYDFQDEANFLFLMRDPRDSFLSLSKYFYNDHHTNYPSSYHIKNFYDHIINNHLVNNYKIFNKLNNSKYNLTTIKFEDLSKQSIPTLKKFCKNYNIKYEHLLTQTTYLGQKIWHKSSYGNLVTGVSKKRVSRYKKDLSIFNIVFLEKIFKKFSHENNYKMEFKNSLLKDILFVISYFYPMNNEILVSKNIWLGNKKGFKNNFLYKLLKYSFFTIRNICLFIYNRIFFNYKFYKIKL